MRKTRVLIGALLGAAAFAASHLVVATKWSTWFGGTADHPPYWTNSASSAPIVFTAANVLTVAAIATVVWTMRGAGVWTMQRAGIDEALQNAATAVLSTTSGATVAMVVIL